MPEPLPSLGLNPPLQRGRLRVFVVASASQVRGRSKHRVDTSQERLTESCQLIRPGFPLTCTCFVCPAHRVTRRNGIFSSSPSSVLSISRVWCLRIAADLYPVCLSPQSSEGEFRDVNVYALEFMRMLMCAGTVSITQYRYGRNPMYN